MKKNYVEEARNELKKEKWWNYVSVKTHAILARNYLVGCIDDADSKQLVRDYEALHFVATTKINPEIELLFPKIPKIDYLEIMKLYQDYLFDNVFTRSEESVEYFHFLLSELLAEKSTGRQK